MEIWSVSGAGGQWDGMKCIRVQAGSQRAPVRLWLCNPCLPAQAPRPPGWVQSSHPAAKAPALGKSASRDEHVPKHLASAESSCGDQLMRTGCGTGQLRALSPGKTGWGMCSPCSAFESKLQAPYALAVGDLNYLQPAPPVGQEQKDSEGKTAGLGACRCQVQMWPLPLPSYGARGSQFPPLGPAFSGIVTSTRAVGRFNYRTQEKTPALNITQKTLENMQ